MSAEDRKSVEALAFNSDRVCVIFTRLFLLELMGQTALDLKIELDKHFTRDIGKRPCSD